MSEVDEFTIRKKRTKNIEMNINDDRMSLN